MAKLTSADRKAMPKSEFSGPGKSFPIPDKVHARLALSGAARAKNVGNITEAQYAHIVKKAHEKLGTKSMAESYTKGR